MNKIIEAAIDDVIDKSDCPMDFKSTFKRYVKNVFNNKRMENDLKEPFPFLKKRGMKNHENVYSWDRI